MVIEISGTSVDYDKARIIERPDGFYWQRMESGEEFGPFATLAKAIEDMEYSDTNIEAPEPLEEAESEIGIADWVDPETGDPAEESIPHIEDH